MSVIVTMITMSLAPPFVFLAGTRTESADRVAVEALVK